ncbi:MAG TPA: hypothetical protein VMT19_08745 [Thermoanaerobaculaceae bacterium]|nr:hypothetical protein [Thermoanaerobaculaceae bacterium]
MGTRLLRALAAVLLGNALYFVAAWPCLPEGLRHREFALDGGLALDFALCAAVYLALGVLLRRHPRR